MRSFKEERHRFTKAALMQNGFTFNFYRMRK
ncbi:MAG: hypothetical protein ACJAU1_001671 [Psychromonas sp.]|jgi:hypothetical protein